MSGRGAALRGHVPLRAASPGLVVPPGRVGYDLRADPLLLHTFVGPRAYEVLVREGVLRADPECIEPEYRQAYDWLRGQARRRVPGASGRSYPIWLWAQTTRRALIDHAAIEAREHPGTVLLTCRIPARRCLLSNFSDWHAVLNGWVCVPWTGAGEPRSGPLLDAYLRRLDREQQEVDAALAAVGLTTAAPIEEWPTPVRSAVEASWELIFDRSRYGRGDVWQATVEQLDLAEVIDAVTII